MADSTKNPVVVTGITPVASGDDWFAIDETGSFSIDRPIIATIWLVGGGCDGGNGYWNSDSGKQCTATRDQGAILSDEDPNKGSALAGGRSGKGGDSGYVFVANNVRIPKGENIAAVVAARNDQTGTSLNITNTLYKCNQSGSWYRKGGDGGWVPSKAEAEANGWEVFADGREDVVNKALVVREKGGLDGVETPFVHTETIDGKNVTTGYVGSSGSGGAACNGGSDATALEPAGQGAGNGDAHRYPGTDAYGYGCGGGGGATCGHSEAYTGREGGLGKQGIIIVQYIVEEKTLVVQKHYKKVTNTKTTCNTDYYSNSSSSRCCGNGGCGYGGVNMSKAADYIDTIHIGQIK